MKKLKFLAFLVFGSIVIFGGCQKDEYKEIVGVCPLVISTIPTDKAVDVPLNQVVSATFNEKMNSETITEESFTLQQGETIIEGAHSYNNVTASLAPSSPLLPFKLYTGRVKTSVKDLMGNSLQEEYVWTFTTIPQITLSSNPEIGGTTLGAGTFKQDSLIMVNATPNSGYSFLNWSENGTNVSTNSAFEHKMAGNTALIANFTLQLVVATTSNPAAGGMTLGAGSYNTGASVTLEAVPNTGYTFTNWTEGVNVVSTNANYTFDITGNRTLEANFASNIAQFTVELSSNPQEGGTTTGAGSFDSGASVTIGAVPASGYKFTNWTEGINEVSSNTNYTFTITDNRVLVANFTENINVGPGSVNLGTASDFSILTMSGISSIGITAVEGNIGVSPAAATAITGFGLIMDTNGQSSHTTIATHVTGKVYASDYAAPTPSKLTVAVLDMQTAYTTANNLVTPAPVLEQGAGNISGLTLAPGLYKWSTGVLIASDGTVTLSGGANDTWVFQIAQDLTLNSSAQVKLIGGAQAKNITWVVAGQAVLGTNTVLQGTILSKTLISLNTGSKVTGSLLAQTAVTLNTSTVNKP